MLVLSRVESEKIYIGREREIEITIISIARGKVRLGISCAREIPIFRSEIAPQLDKPRGDGSNGSKAEGEKRS